MQKKRKQIIEELRSEISTNQFLQSARANLGLMLQWKKTIYQQRLQQLPVDAISEFESLKKKMTVSEIRLHFPHLFLLFQMREKLQEILGLIERKLREYSIETDPTLESNKQSVIKQRLFNCLDDPKLGLVALGSNASHRFIRNLLVNRIYSLKNGYRQFVSVFSNILLLGPAGVGKTFIARLIAYVMSQLGVVLFENLLEVTTKSFIGETLNSTAVQTSLILIEALDRVLFFDEAYEIGCFPKNSGDVRSAAVTEIVKWMDDNIGLSIIIAAGYEKEMKQCFLTSNPGLERRFMDTIKLSRYTTAELVNMLQKQISDKLDQKNMFSPIETQYLLSRIQQMQDYVDYDLLAFQAGDIFNMSSLFIRHIMAAPHKKWKKGDFENNCFFLDKMFSDFIHMKLGKQPKYLQNQRILQKSEKSIPPNYSKKCVIMLNGKRNEQCIVLFKKQKCIIQWADIKNGKKTITSRNMVWTRSLYRRFNSLFNKVFQYSQPDSNELLSSIDLINDTQTTIEWNDHKIQMNKHRWNELPIHCQLKWGQWFELVLYIRSVCLLT
jgi:hypothetical protein